MSIMTFTKTRKWYKIDYILAYCIQAKGHDKDKDDCYDNDSDNDSGSCPLIYTKQLNVK